MPVIVVLANGDVDSVFHVNSFVDPYKIQKEIIAKYKERYGNNLTDICVQFCSDLHDVRCIHADELNNHIVGIYMES